MKQIIIRSLIACAAFVMASGVVLADTWTDPDTGYTWTYRIINGDEAESEAEIYAILPNPIGAVTIPSALGGKPVTSIGYWAFSDRDSLTSVTIPVGVTSIESYAFYGCSGLTSVTIPVSVTSIESYAFLGCGGLMSFEVAADNPSYKAVSGLLLTKDGKTLIAGVNGDVAIPAGVTSIGAEAFHNCSGLKSVTIPGSVTSIGGGAFSGCSGLMSFEVAADNPSYKAVSGLLLTKDGKTLIAGVNGDVAIPAGVTSIGAEAFYNFSGLTSVAIPDSVTSIGSYVFYDCSGLTRVTIPDSVTSIGDYAFLGCSGLKSATIPSSVTSIGSHAFYDCSGLTSVGVPQCVLDRGISSVFRDAYSSITNVFCTSVIINIGSYAFHGCSSLANVMIPNGVTSIGDSAFEGCSGLKSVTIPKGVTNIGYSAFRDCGTLISVTIPDSVTDIGPYAFYGCGELTSMVMPDGLTAIWSYAFRGCTNLTSVMTPLSVTIIGDGAFVGCSGLTSVTIPDGVTSIGDVAFAGCSGLTNVTIPSSVTSIGDRAFSGCSGLISISVAAGNTNYSSVNDLMLTKDGKMLIQGVNGDVVIPNSVTSIWSYAFSGCSGLTSVAMPNSVMRIESYAFSGCSGLTSVAIPSSVTSIGSYAFWGCDGLMSFEVVANNPSYKAVSGLLLTKDGKTLVAGVNGDVAIPDGVTSIGWLEFVGCRGLTSVTIPDSVTRISVNAFSDCNDLTNITFNGNAPAFVGSYGNSDFFGDYVHCTVHVRRGSTGWGVDIPGSWKGLQIEYIEDELPSSTTCTVVFDSNGGSVSPALLTVALGKSVGSLPKAKKKGYTFKGWYMKKSGGSKVKTKTKVTKDVTYYARWTANKYKIKFDKNGGTGTMKTLSATYGKNVKLTANVFKRSKHTFQGWAKKKNGEVAYADKAKVKNLTATDGKTVTLYAVWKHNSYKVKFNANGGTGAAQSQTVKCGAKTKLAANAYVREGFEFAGWAKKQGGPVVYKNKASVKDLAKNGKTVTLYAVWKPAKWAVGTFMGEGTVGGKAVTVTLTVSSDGKISGKFVRTKDKKAYSFKTDGFDEYSDGALRATTTLKYGSKTCALEIAVGQAVPDDGVAVTFAEMEATSGGKTYATAFLQLRK